MQKNGFIFYERTTIPQKGILGNKSETKINIDKKLLKCWFHSESKIKL